MYKIEIARTLEDEFDRRLSVGRRVGVGHRDDRRDAARERGHGAGLDCLPILAPRLAEMHGHVDESGRDDESLRIDRLIRLFLTVAPDVRNLAVLYENVGKRVDAIFGVYHSAAFDT